MMSGAGIYWLRSQRQKDKDAVAERDNLLKASGSTKPIAEAPIAMTLPTDKLRQSMAIKIGSRDR